MLHALVDFNKSVIYKLCEKTQVLKNTFLNVKNNKNMIMCIIKYKKNIGNDELEIILVVKVVKTSFQNGK